MNSEVSSICLEALKRTKLVYPTVGICWHEGTPVELAGLAIELIAAGYTTPAFPGDAGRDTTANRVRHFLKFWNINDILGGIPE